MGEAREELVLRGVELFQPHNHRVTDLCHPNVGDKHERAQDSQYRTQEKHTTQMQSKQHTHQNTQHTHTQHINTHTISFTRKKARCHPLENQSCHSGVGSWIIKLISPDMIGKLEAARKEVSTLTKQLQRTQNKIEDLMGKKAHANELAKTYVACVRLS